MEGLWTVLLIAFAGLIFAPGESRRQRSPFDTIEKACPGVENEMKKCIIRQGFIIPGITTNQLIALQSDPARVQELKGKAEDSCKNGRISAMIHCYFDALKSKCSAQLYKQVTMFASEDTMNELTKFVCDNLDSLTDPAMKTCLDTLRSNPRKLSSCIKARATELRHKILAAPLSDIRLAVMCYSSDVSVDCMKPHLKTCPKGGEVVIKMMSIMKPKGCKDYTLAAGTKPKGSKDDTLAAGTKPKGSKDYSLGAWKQKGSKDYTLAAGMMKPSILMVFVITAFSLFFVYAY